MSKNYEFSKWEEDLVFVKDCLKEVLTELDLSSLIAYIPWDNTDTQNFPAAPINKRSVQILSLCFSLLNMVEENTANQTRRQKVDPQRGLWDSVFLEMKDAGCSVETIGDLCLTVSIQPVLTAHPTEAKRATMLEHHRRLYMLLVKRENTMWSALEQEEIKSSIK